MIHGLGTIFCLTALFCGAALLLPLVPVAGAWHRMARGLRRMAWDERLAALMAAGIAALMAGLVVWALVLSCRAGYPHPEHYSRHLAIYFLGAILLPNALLLCWYRRMSKRGAGEWLWCVFSVALALYWSGFFIQWFVLTHIWYAWERLGGFGFQESYRLTKQVALVAAAVTAPAVGLAFLARRLGHRPCNMAARFRWKRKEGDQ